MQDTNDKQPITDVHAQGVIAQAITDVASEKFAKLAAASQPFEIVEKLTDGLIGLRDLRRGIMPNYNSWTAFCYLTWYQPHHINLAFTMLTELSGFIRSKIFDAGGVDCFRWIDFGCGSLPMHTALYVASAMGAVVPSPTTRILSNGIDSSGSMMRTGVDLVRAIGKIDSRLARGSENLRISANLPAEPGGTRASVQTPTILSVMHTFYRENISSVASELGSLIEKTNPELILVTVHPSSDGLVDQAFSQHGDQYDMESKRYDYSQPLRFTGKLTSVTALREKLADFIEIQRVNVVNEGLSSQSDYAGVYDAGLAEWDGNSHSIRRYLYGPASQFLYETDIAISYLKREVFWSGAEVEARVYFRKQT